jgi:hypothetical protein
MQMQEHASEAPEHRKQQQKKKNGIQHKAGANATFEQAMAEVMAEAAAS